ncbi:bifunctional diguanylate cyclase/phosphodiesterase [Methylobacter luteus]|uniref:bifunctional diguanylate cyclase/phosphodiesterase n=1 Tax=Methylobacter luteus TaxID=415 RepID=UPI0004032721|nr:EAL domain-containing protein [Methylobacter luteus]
MKSFLAQVFTGKSILNQLRGYRWSDLAQLISLTLVYALTVTIVLTYLTTDATTISIIWIPAGIGLAALLIGGLKYWPALLTGSLLARLALGNAMLPSIFTALSNTIEPLLAVWILRQESAWKRWAPHRFDPALMHPCDYYWLALAGAIAAVVASLIGVAAFWQAGIITARMIPDSLLHWWMGNTLGIILVTPLLLVWRQTPSDWFKHQRIFETLACFGLAFLAGQFIFLDWFIDALGNFANGFIMFLFVAWSAVRFGRHGALLIIGMTALQALLGAVNGIGYFDADIAQTGLVNLWIYILELTVVGMALALIITARTQAENELRVSKERWKFALEGAGDGVWDWNLQTHEIFLSPRCKEILNFPLDEQKSSDQDWKSITNPADYERLMSDLQACLEGRTTSFISEHRIRYPNNNWKWLVTRGMVVSRDAAGKPLRMIGTHRDISKRKQMQWSQVHTILEASPECMLLVDNDGIILFANQVAAQVFAYPISELIGLNVDMLVPMFASAGHSAEFMRIPHPRSTDINNRLSAIRKNGTEFPIEISLSPVELDNRLNVIASIIDITERKHFEQKLQLSAMIYRAIGEAIMVADPSNRIIAINPAFTQLTGYTEQEAIGRSTKLLKSGRHDAAFYRDMWHMLEKTGRWQGQVWNLRKNGEEYFEWLMINTIYDSDGEVQQRIAIFSDITDQKLAEQTIWQQANFDPLTGLPNRCLFQDRLEQDIKKSHRTGLPMALMLLDLDRFKEVNDTLGHDMGDILLKEGARRLSSCVRGTDTVARLGGDEFTIILSELHDPANVERIAQDILKELAEPFHLKREVAYVSASIGITLYPNDGANIETLLKNADQAMYASKNQGRNRYNYFIPSMQEAAQNRMRLANDLRGALEADQFSLVYQPIVELATGVIHKAEALIRWQHPNRGEVSPTEFITIAEETGLIIDIGDWVFRETACQVKHWRERHHADFQISINKSPIQFHNKSNSHAAWFEHMRQQGLSGQSIVVEITEGLLLDASTTITDQLLDFRDAGVQVALDDFGTGYSSLSYLKKFDIDYLKIDRSFVSNLAPGSDDMALCEAIIVMAHKLGIKVIAEGVETVQQRNLLSTVGCDYGQGYLFSKPLPAVEFEKLLAAG